MEFLKKIGIGRNRRIFDIIFKEKFGSDRQKLELAMKTAILLIMMTAACSCVTSLDLQKAFTEHEVIPDILKVGPKNILQVSLIEILQSELSSESSMFRCHTLVAFLLIWATR